MKKRTRAGLKESGEERRRLVRDAGDLVRCLTIESEIELGRGLAGIPVGKVFELAPSLTSPVERVNGKEACLQATRPFYSTVTAVEVRDFWSMASERAS